MSDLDEEAAVNDRSALTLSRSNDARIQAQQISCRGKEGRKEGQQQRRRRFKKDMREEETNRLKTNAQKSAECTEECDNIVEL